MYCKSISGFDCIRVIKAISYYRHHRNIFNRYKSRDVSTNLLCRDVSRDNCVIPLLRDTNRDDCRLSFRRDVNRDD